MKIADGIEMLVITSQVRGKEQTIYPTLLIDQDQVILVDTGFPGQLPVFKAAFEQAGVDFNRLNIVILTHHDLDHLGGLAGLKAALPGPVKTLALTQEQPYIEGTKTPLKLAQIEATLDSQPEAARELYQQMKAGYGQCYVKVDQTLADGEELPYCGGIKIIHTPGHTLGHICLYLQQSKTLIAGDALNSTTGILTKAPARLNYDEEMATASLKKLTGLDIETVICYHGGLYTDHPGQRIAVLAQGGN